MKLDESIELKNLKIKNFNINEMKQTHRMSISEMRYKMQEMMKKDDASSCLYEVLTMEGFLPETMDESETYENTLHPMMEDDDVMYEMYKACSMNESSCGMKLREYLNEKLVGGQKKLDANDNGKIDSNDFEMLRKKKSLHDEGFDGLEEGKTKKYDKEKYSDSDKKMKKSMKDYYGKKKGEEVFYATKNKRKEEDTVDEGYEPEGDHYKRMIDQIMSDLQPISDSLSGVADLPSWVQDKLAVMAHSADAINSYMGKLNPGMSVNMNESDDDDEDDEDEIDNPEYLNTKLRQAEAMATKYVKHVNKLVQKYVPKIDPNLVRSFYRGKDEFTTEGFINFLTKQEDESNYDFYERLENSGDWIYREVFLGLTNPRKRSLVPKIAAAIGRGSDDFEETISDIFDESLRIDNKKREIDKIQAGINNRGTKKLSGDDDFDELDDEEIASKAARAASGGKFDANLDFLGGSDDEDEDKDFLKEMNLPVKGKNVDSSNATNANKENKEGTTNAEKTQKTVQQKVDNLKNQKYELNDNEKEIKDTFHGAYNDLDLDYKNTASKDFKDRVKKEAEGMAPKDHANVDHESESGKKLVDAAKKRADDKEVIDDMWTSSHDITAIEPSATYKKTGVFREERKLKENVDRIKRLFDY